MKIVIDERVQEDGTGKRAYGPQFVHMLAQRSLNQGGGATRASTNADSYAWLVNSLYFYDATGYFPAPPKWKGPSSMAELGLTWSPESQTRSQDIFPVHLGSFDSHPSDETLETRFKAEVEDKKNLDNKPPVDKCESDADCSSPNCAGGMAVYACIEKTCQCHYPEAPEPEPEPEGPPPGTKCYEDISEEDCLKYECPEGMETGCAKTSLLDVFWCTCYESHA